MRNQFIFKINHSIYVNIIQVLFYKSIVKIIFTKNLKTLENEKNCIAWLYFWFVLLLFYSFNYSFNNCDTFSKIWKLKIAYRSDETLDK